MIFPCSSVTADPTAALSAFHVQIFSPERVTSHAMLSVKDREVHSAQRVHLSGDSFQMPWVYALFVFAQMVNLQVLWDWAKEELIRKAMGVFFLGVCNGISAVSSTVTSGDPEPATRLSIDKNLLSKTLRKSVNSNAKHTAPTIPHLRDVVGVFAYD
jgi:hypothetical protein